MRIHPSITLERVMNAVERRETDLENPGFCLACGEEQEGCEPDARNYQCDSCEKHQVFGAEEILFML